ncbi:universal stress protein [Adhaeribacter rhizoryzae]|uniref:Universal stress protein n=1 Tax=Adhaeribacter rhizoryzae TaxID=2607907 RepID=A0A5M6D3H7_9BACT|nr:universal stress protein [Adhaeribacter rhizoryzae]KAA5541150.1 universal stress protein [Adhaeribacter rhizoryzae]
MKNILVPTDFSDNAANALAYAVQLARFAQGQIILFHNAELPINYAGANIYAAGAGDIGIGATPLYPGVGFPEPEMERMQQEKLNSLAEQILQDRQFHIPVKTVFKYGSLTGNIADLVREEQVDLIIMGTKGANSFLDRLVGTNTASVIKETHGVPVLAIPSEARFTAPHRIVFAADLENETAIYLNQLLTFAQPFGAQITLVHIVSQNKPELINEELILSELRTRFPEHQLQLVKRTGETVAQGLENYLKEHPADLLAVGIHTHGFWYSLFHSSVTEELVFHAALPLLALPEKPIARV